MTADLTIDGAAASRADPAEQERLPVRARCGDGQAAQRRRIHRSELGQRRRHEDRPSERGAEARYEKKPWNLAPGVQGGHSWHPNAFSPETGLVYIPTWEAYFPMIADPNYKPSTAGGSTSASAFGGPNMAATNLEPTNKTGITGRLKAWDPVARKIGLGNRSVRERSPDGRRARNGGRPRVRGQRRAARSCAPTTRRAAQQLWSYKTQTNIYAPPITYELDGQQYVAASVGGVAQGGYFAPGLLAHARVRARRHRAAAAERGIHAAAAESAGLDGRRRRHQARAARSTRSTARSAMAQTASCSAARSRTSWSAPMLHTQEGFDRWCCRACAPRRAWARSRRTSQPDDSRGGA